jgi:class 3 adenylate cyclase
VTEEFCPKTLSVYPSQEMEDDYVTSDPILLTVAALLIFVFTSMVFFLYDWLVERRQKKVMRTAVQSTAIVSSLFPSQVRDRLFPIEDAKEDADKGKNPKGFRATDRAADSGAKAAYSPVADLYPEATVMFADIAGFTAWSSVREPKQVFTLLETLYGAFDTIADRRGVFKVETIGDSYVAVVGLPEPRKDHAVVMARFARDCRDDMSRLTRKLEITLGPDTNDLQLRFGLHSGPVTAGVLRGQKSRFQLFGDTVNTAARMESNGIRNRIQVSQTTADLLIAAGKEHWVTKRDELVTAKGKGKMQTYWVDPKNSSGSVASSFSQPNQSSRELSIIEDKTQRLVDWNSEVLGRLMRQILAKRNASSKGTTSEASSKGISSSKILPIGATALNEIKEIIDLPKFDAAVVRNQEEPESIELDDVVSSQLREYVFTVATMYRENLFHNFEHASHVAMSVVKLLCCNVTLEGEALSGSQQKIASSPHEDTYGSIMSDPLTQFACVFSALIHNVDHPGVPNTQLAKENLHIAGDYKGESVAEKNSVDLAWNAFMDERFNKLRHTLCATEEELAGLRQLVVNSVLATDIMDKELKTLRNARWDKAFLEAPPVLESDRDTGNCKATIVIEHVMQASGIAHTMQHFEIYQKWNELLFAEMYTAYVNGRADKDPSEFWYRGELDSFDFCIPLAKKLRDCGAFGASSDEYLACALKNRQEWEAQGQEVVASMLEKYEGKRAV